ncbi:MAG TPA: sigma-54 dependent transcriptional regulator [Gemmatimonadaceae bacterium]|jgi:two-component system nitrogen regulation response regulator NtrX|nr:sigma-54 dependent transcriptional regulator [Gemmatimonadaceae bacterium]
MTAARRILIIDDEQGIRGALGQLLEFEGYEVRSAANAVDGIAAYQRQRPDLVFLDVKMAGIDGVEALKKIKEGDPTAIVVMISGHATIQTAVEATQLGAYDILEKPLDTDRILVTLRNALQHLDLHEENARLKETIQSRYEIVGRSYGIRAVIDKIERVGKTPARVLITGENGTGKELVARALHAQSTRAKGPFVEVNCAAIPSELIESELFGHMKGSFTGAISDRAGKFEQADGGTLFLDEVGDMSLAAQAKVLRVLQDGVVTRIGGAKHVEVDVRVLAATNKNLESEIAEGRFREDLFYRLNVVPIHVPPLRERREDIPLLVAHFVAVLSGSQGVAPRAVAPEAVERLSQLDWPGNVRELRNTIERLLILAAGPRILADDVARLVGTRDTEQAGLGSLLSCKTFEEFKHAAERAFLLAKLRELDWNVSETARALEMPRSNLYKKIERYGLTRETVS